MFFKETYSGVFPKGPNSWIYSIKFKPLLLTLIFQCGINLLFFLLRILSIFNTHTHGKRGECFLKKLTVVYFQKGLILGYTAHALNLFYPHSSFNVEEALWSWMNILDFFFFFFFEMAVGHGLILFLWIFLICKNSAN